MVNRKPSSSGDAEAATGPASSSPDRPSTPGGSESHELEALLRRLDETTEGADELSASELDRLATEAAEHASSITSTARAQQQAQRLLAMAAQERARVSAEATEMLEEARALTTRLRAEAEQHAREERERTSARAAKERAAIEEVVADLQATAAREAERLLAESQQRAMIEARREARTYVARAAALGARDAEAHRAAAREVLARGAELVETAQSTMQELVDGMTRVLTGLGSQLDQIREVAEQAASEVADAEAATPIEAETGSWALAGADEDLDDPATFAHLDEEAFLAAVEEKVADAELEEAVVADLATEAGTETDDLVEDDQTDEPAADDAPAAETSTATPPAKPAPTRPANRKPSTQRRKPAKAGEGRPLGSLFRGPDNW